MATAPLRTRIPLDLIAGFALLIAMVGGGLLFARQRAADAEQMGRLFATGRALADVLAATRDAEIGQRGYLLTADPAYLEPYRDADFRVRTAFTRLEEQQVDVARLRTLVTVKFTEMRSTIRLFNRGRREDAVEMVRAGIGQSAMRRVRDEAGAAQQRVRAALDRDAARGIRTAWLLTIGLLVGLIGVLGTAWAALRQHQRQVAVLAGARDRAEDAYASAVAANAARETAEAQLRQVQKIESIGQLTGGIAHDFNNMLAIVIGSLDLAQRRLLDDPERLTQCLDNAREGAERAASLTQRLLAFSRQQPLAPTAIELNRLVGGMSELLRRTLGEEIAVETVLAGGLWRAYADASQLENALLNLAVNGRDAMPGETGGKLTIETGNAYLDDAYARTHADVTPGQYVMVSVSDTGVGMEPHVIERAFDPFFTTKDVGKGTGLGLSQVFGFVKQSGGHVSIYSEPGEGTTVKLYLPRHSGPVAAPIAVPPMGRPLPEGRVDELVLVVEDETRVRHFSVEALQELGYSTLAAADGPSALSILRDHPSVTLLFTDIVMPEMNGRRLAEEARAALPDLKVLYTTGYTRNAVVHNGMLDAGVAFLPKPFTIGQLAVKVREVIDGAGINRPA